MDQGLESYDLSANNESKKAPVRVEKGGQGKSSNKCNQCDYASSHLGNLKRHLTVYSGEKSNKCNQCN